MARRIFSMCLFYDTDLNIAVQKRGIASVYGEKYAFWGGAAEEGESPEETIKRELYEELSFVPTDLKYWGKSLFTTNDKTKSHYGTYELNVFITPVSKELLEAKVSEGESLILMPIDDVILGEGFTEGITDFVKELKNDLILEIKKGQ